MVLLFCQGTFVTPLPGFGSVFGLSLHRNLQTFLLAVVLVLLSIAGSSTKL